MVSILRFPPIRPPRRPSAAMTRDTSSVDGSCALRLWSRVSRSTIACAETFKSRDGFLTRFGMAQYRTAIQAQRCASPVKLDHYPLRPPELPPVAATPQGAIEPLDPRRPPSRVQSTLAGRRATPRSWQQSQPRAPPVALECRAARVPSAEPSASRPSFDRYRTRDQTIDTRDGWHRTHGRRRTPSPAHTSAWPPASGRADHRTPR